MGNMYASNEQSIVQIPPRRVQFTQKTMWIRKFMLSVWIVFTLFCGRQFVADGRGDLLLLPLFLTVVCIGIEWHFWMNHNLLRYGILTQATIRKRWMIPMSNPPIEYISYNFIAPNGRRIYSEIQISKLFAWEPGVVIPILHAPQDPYRNRPLLLCKDIEVIS
jgi:hypothetical protein